MNENETYYRKTAGAIGLTMLFFLLFLNVFSTVYTVFSMLLAFLLPNAPVAVEVVSQIIYAAGYMACFMCPVAILKWRIKRAGLDYRPMQAAPRVSPWIFLMIPACITVVFAAAYINSVMVSFVDFSKLPTDITVTSGSNQPFRMVLDFIVICVVPGFCEEFLFRGAILTNCRRFGRTNAILISSILFSTMHQNPAQLLYTFVAGLLLGMIYEMTGSIWNCTVIHIFNNFISTYEGWLDSFFEDMLESSLYVTLFELAFFVVGMISLVILIRRFFDHKQSTTDGIFARPLKEAESYAQYPISSRQAVRLFITPTTVIYFVACALQVLLIFAILLLASVFTI